MSHRFLFLVLLAVPTGLVSAATFVVRSDGSGDYPTIQAAVDAAATSGDTILLGNARAAPTVISFAKKKPVFILGHFLLYALS